MILISCETQQKVQQLDFFPPQHSVKSGAKSKIVVSSKNWFKYIKIEKLLSNDVIHQ